MQNAETDLCITTPIILPDCHWGCSLSKFHQFELSWSIVLKFSMNCVFTFEGEHDFWFLHLTTFKARFLHLRLKFFLHLWLKKFLQLRVVFTNEVDFFTFVVDFYKMKFFYIWGCNKPPAQLVSFSWFSRLVHGSRLLLR